jgi:hypothetical protein
MAHKWYFARAGQTHGPFSSDQLKEQAVAGQLEPADSVWTEGMAKRVLAAKVQHLFTGIPPRTFAPAPRPVVAEAPVLPQAEEQPAAEPDDIPNDPPLIPLESETAAKTPAAPPEEPRAEKSAPPKPPEVRKRRVIHVKGAILQSQDGSIMRFKKKCIKCNHEDTSLTTLQIPCGTMRMGYFCPKCRKNHPVEIQGV